jgi:hypothetical protein
LSVLATFVVTTITFVACGSRDDTGFIPNPLSGGPCQPGSVRECLGPMSCLGEQKCAPNGKGYAACICLMHGKKNVGSGGDASDGATSNGDAAPDGPTSNADAASDGPTSNADAASDGPTSNADAAADGPTSNADAASDGPSSNGDASDDGPTSSDANDDAMPKFRLLGAGGTTAQTDDSP